MNNLATLLRPTSLENFVGQSHIVGEGKALYNLIQKKEIPHLFFYGKPGTGKTSLAKIIAKHINTDYHYFNATTIKVEELRAVFKRYENSLIKPIVFIDEVHRLSKNQQEVLLPIMESYQAIIIGASTENPFYTLTNAIRSRAFLFEFKSLSYKELDNLLTMALMHLKIDINEDIKNHLIHSSSGDARAMLNLLDYAHKVDANFTIDTLKQLRSASMSDGCNAKDTHYDLASAMIKSLRGSDVNASLYYLARLIDGGERIEFITRRLMIFASEDIGNANPNALNLATSTHTSAVFVGYPEARIILAQCVVYLASSPKSNHSYCAINKALQEIKDGRIIDIPNHIKTHSKDYKYPHDYGGWVEQSYLSQDMTFYEASNIGFEKTLNDWLEKIKTNKKG